MIILFALYMDSETLWAMSVIYTVYLSAYLEYFETCCLLKQDLMHMYVQSV